MTDYLNTKIATDVEDDEWIEGKGLFKGAHVIAQGLESKEGKKLNGKHGTLLSYSYEKKRWTVQLACDGKPIMKNLKATNLKGTKNMPAYLKTQSKMLRTVASKQEFFHHLYQKGKVGRRISLNELSQSFAIGSITPAAAFDNEHGDSITYLAAGTNNVDMLEWLHERELCQVNKPEPDTVDVRPFYFACQNGNLRAAKWLHKHGADVNLGTASIMPGGQGCPPIEIATIMGHTKVVKWLRKMGATSSMTAKDAEGVQDMLFKNKQSPLDMMPSNFRNACNSTAKGRNAMLKKNQRTGCALCGKPNAKNKCSICKEVRYCDRTCQTAHWKEIHKYSSCGKKARNKKKL